MRSFPYLYVVFRNRHKRNISQSNLQGFGKIFFWTLNALIHRAGEFVEFR